MSESTNATPPNTCPTLYTVGHSDHPFAVLAELLTRHAITDLVDVRSAPYSRHVPHASKPELERTLPDRGITYHFFGQSLGGRPDDANVYDNGQIVYARVMARRWFRTGIADLLALVRRVTDSGGHVAIMCSERDPLDCHRHHLIARALIDAGAGVVTEPQVAVAHILADGSLRHVTAADFDAPQQLTLL